MEILLALLSGVGIGFFIGLNYTLKRFYRNDNKEVAAVPVVHQTTSGSGVILPIKEGRKKEDDTA